MFELKNLTNWNRNKFLKCNEKASNVCKLAKWIILK